MLTVEEARPSEAEAAADQAKRKLALLLLWVLALMIFVECFTRVLHNRRRITLAVEQSIREAAAIRPAPGRKQALFLGNSLIFDDVAQPALQDAMGRDCVVHTVGVSGSTYYDWEYGLRALFQRGSRPDVVVFAISPSQYLRAPTVTPMIVSQLWTNREVFAYRRDQNLRPTALTELLFERHSTFFALRDIVRIYARKAIPGFAGLVGAWARPTPSLPTENQAPSKGAYSEKLRLLTRSLPPGTRLIVLIPPTNQPNDAANEPYLRAAANELGIPVEEPVREYQWPPTKFQPDAYHLNHRAAIEYSRLVGADIARLPAPQAPNPAAATRGGQ